LQKHFTEDQFEQRRVDGWKKLKTTAVPSLFSHRPEQKCSRRRQPTQYIEPDSKVQ
jgi:hypothetical protein